MKIPSISRIPKYQKFNYTPRFYDPIKEELEERKERIRRGLERNPTIHSYQSTIHNAFKRRAKENKQSNIIQLLVIAVLLATFFGYIYYGNLVFYLFLVLIPVYIFIRKKNFFRKH